MNEKIELLCPAGNLESFKAACQNGANAIYMGLDKFNARTMAKNFDIESYISCIEYAHLRNIKIYLTMNTLLYDDEIKEALELVGRLYEKGLDAIIVQDIGFASLVHKTFPKLHMHASTQMSIYSLEQVKFMEGLGFSRVVLARELTIEEIEYICKNTNLEIEVFVHGALCVCVSGQCLLSATIGSRSANRGSCAQPCRMKYSLYNSKDKLLGKETYMLSKKDIFGFDLVERLIKAGVSSLKIEGRNKTPEYVAAVTSAYRKKIDKNIEDENAEKHHLEQMFNRNGISTGYLEKVRYKDTVTLLSPKNTGIFLGKVLDKKKKYVKVKLEEDISLHDGFEIYSDGATVSNIVTCIRDDKFNITNKLAKKGEYVWIGDVPKSVKLYDFVYKTSSDNLNKKYKKSYETENIKRNVYLNIIIKKEKKVYIEYSLDGKLVKLTYDYIPDISINKEVGIEDIKKAFDKTVDIPFKFVIQNLNIDSNLFIPISKLNDMRRFVYENIIDSTKIQNNIPKNYDEFLKIPKKQEKIVSKNNKKSLCIYNYDDKKDYKFDSYDIIEIQIQDYIKFERSIANKINKEKLYLVIPNFTLDKVDNYILANIEKIAKDKISGIIVSNFKFYNQIKKLKDKYQLKLIADYGFNVSNIYSANILKEYGFDAIIPAYEISINDILNMSEYVNLCIQNDYLVVMSSRYCLLGNFLAKREDKLQKCSMPCVKDEYYLKDTYGYKYNISCDNLDCVMRILKRIRNIDLNEYDICNIEYIRNTVI